jgi:hypothetical protein
MLRLIRILRILRIDRVRGEEGFALAVVIGIAAVLFVVTMGALSYSVSALTKAGTDVNGEAATAAAYAGVSDYEARLTNDNTYQKYGDPTAPFSTLTNSTSLVLPPPNADGTPGNPAFGWGVNGTWAAVPGSTSNAAFRYEVDNSDYAAQGIIRILATGRSGNQTRSFIANVRQNGFLNYLYFTDFETQDPSLIGVTPTSTCAKYYPARNENTCGGLIQFTSGETVNGPIDSNDALDICGGTFNGTITSNYATAPYYINCGAAVDGSGKPIKPVYGPKLTMPATNTAMKNETRGDLTSSTVPRPGCLYTGPTSIVFNSNGTMTVRSPWSKYMNTTGANAAGATTGMATVPANFCGTAGSATGDLGSPAGQTIAVPTQNLIFVQTVPTIVGDANYWASNASPTGAACVTNGNDLGYPLSTTTGTGNSQVVTTETTVRSPAGTNYYGCRSGDAFVQGTLSGQVTVAADNYVWITGDLVYNNLSSDILGLVGQNAVWVWNPAGTTKVGNGNTSSVTTLLTDGGRTIDAAIMSVSHTFQVQNYNAYSTNNPNPNVNGRGTLTVLGAIAQEFRGTVGGTVNGTAVGYSKQYSYDTRLRNIAPPKFLQAVSTTYGVSQLAEVPAAFTSNGAST